MKIIKRMFAIFLALMFCGQSFAAIVSDNDGSAFVTKAEFDALKKSFQTQVDKYNSSIDGKIDGAIAAYLSGIRISTTEARAIVGYSSEGTLCPLDKVDLLWQQGDVGINGTAVQLNYPMMDFTKEDAEAGVDGCRLFEHGRSVSQYGYNFTAATGRRKFKNRLIKNVDYRTGVAEWVGYGDTDDTILLSSLSSLPYGVNVDPGAYEGFQYAIGCPGYGWGGDKEASENTSAYYYSGWTPTKAATPTTRTWVWNDSTGFSNENFSSKNLTLGKLQLYRALPTDNPGSAWSLSIDSKSSKFGRDSMNITNTSIVSLTSTAAVTRLGTSDSIRDFMNDADMSSHEFNFDYSKNFSGNLNFRGTVFFVDPVAGSYNATTGAFTPHSSKNYVPSSVLDAADNAKNIGMGSKRISATNIFIKNDLGRGRGSGSSYVRFDDDRDKRNAYSDIYFGFVKPTDKWSKLWTSKYDTNLKIMQNYDSNLNILKNTCYYTADEFAPGDNSEHLSINAGLPVCEVEKGENISFTVKFADSGNYNLWIKPRSFVNDKEPWEDECIAPSKITNASGANYPVGHKNNCIKLTGGTEHTINYTPEDKSYIFLKWSKADGTNDEKGGGRIYLGEQAIIIRED